MKSAPDLEDDARELGASPRPCSRVCGRSFGGFAGRAGFAGAAARSRRSPRQARPRDGLRGTDGAPSTVGRRGLDGDRRLRRHRRPRRRRSAASRATPRRLRRRAPSAAAPPARGQLRARRPPSCRPSCTLVVVSVMSISRRSKIACALPGMSMRIASSVISMILPKTMSPGVDRRPLARGPLALARFG